MHRPTFQFMSRQFYRIFLSMTFLFFINLFQRPCSQRFSKNRKPLALFIERCWSYLDIDFSPNRFLSSISRYPCECGDIHVPDTVKTFKSTGLSESRLSRQRNKYKRIYVQHIFMNIYSEH